MVSQRTILLPHVWMNWFHRDPGGGNGNPLQHSCLKNSTDRRVYWATVHGVAKESDTTERLSMRRDQVSCPIAKVEFQSKIQFLYVCMNLKAWTHCMLVVRWLWQQSKMKNSPHPSRRVIRNLRTSFRLSKESLEPCSCHLGALLRWWRQSSCVVKLIDHKI